MSPEMIAYARTAFVAATKLNVGRMSKQNLELQYKLYASEKRVVKA